MDLGGIQGLEVHNLLLYFCFHTLHIQKFKVASIQYMMTYSLWWKGMTMTMTKRVELKPNTKKKNMMAAEGMVLLRMIWLFFFGPKNDLA